jgi:transposase-like protein
MTRDEQRAVRTERAAALVQRLQAGATKSELARELGLSRERIGQIVDPILPRKRPPWTDERKQMLRVLRDNGLSLSEIARWLEVSRSTVVRKINLMGLPGRPSPIRRAA